MKIALLGYGKMGKAIEGLALDGGKHEGGTQWLEGMADKQ